MNAFGPSFYHFKNDKTIYEHLNGYIGAVNIDLKLNDHSAFDERSNIYGLMEAGSVYPNVGSQMPAVFIQPNTNLLEFCTYLNGSQQCLIPGITFDANEWFNIRIINFCWDKCYFVLAKDGEVEFYWINTTYNQTMIAHDVSGVIGNTYNQVDIVAASGEYKNFEVFIDSYENEAFFETELDESGAENFQNN